MPLSPNLKTGLRGEQLTARWLREHGYTVIDANFTTFSGETDIIALSPENNLCFVEVKTRAPGGMLPPIEAVGKEKQKRLLNNASAYLKSVKEKYNEVEFDVSEVILYDLTHAEITLHRNYFGFDF